MPDRPVYGRSICASAPGSRKEVSVLGIVLLVASIYFGGGIIAHDPYWGPVLTFKDTTITFTLIGYAVYLRAAAGVADFGAARITSRPS